MNESRDPEARVLFQTLHESRGAVMPPLYRMPITYVGVAFIALTVWVSGLFGRDPSADRSDRPTAENAPTAAALDRSAPAATTADPPDDSAPVEPGADGILRTSEGLRRKVLVTELGLKPSDRPGDPPFGPDLDYYGIHFVRDEETIDRTTYLELGNADGLSIGWVPADAVLEWPTRLVAVPTPRGDRPKLLLYRERSCLLDTLAGRVHREHGPGACPIVGEEPEPPPGSEAARANPDPMMGLPILGFESIPQPDGSERTVLEVASLVADRAPPPPPPAEPPEHLKRWLENVYIAFVIDTTSSMRAWIDEARALAEGLASEAARLDVNLRFALVAYRDDHDGFGYKTRIVSRFAGVAGLREALDRIEAARRGDGTIDEAVLDGVATALPALEGEDRFEHLPWPIGRPGELATKLIVLIGDAPDHARDLERAQALAKRAQDARITIAAVLIRRDDLRGDEPQRYRRQWETLAAGSFRPRDPKAGFDRPIAPVLPALEDASELRPTLEALFEDRFEHARELARLAEAEAEGRLRDYVNRRGLTLDQVAPVLVDLHRGEARPRPRKDPRQNGRKAPSVRRGWIAERRDGHTMVSLQLMMTREELTALIDELSRFQRAVEGGSEDLSDLLRIGTAAAAGETAFLEADRGETTFAEYLRRRRGLPPSRPDSLLNRSAADLRHADDLYRAAVNRRLSAAIAALIRRRNQPDWDDPDRTLSGLAMVPYGPIDF